MTRLKTDQADYSPADDVTQSGVIHNGPHAKDPCHIEKRAVVDRLTGRPALKYSHEGKHAHETGCKRHPGR